MLFLNNLDYLIYSSHKTATQSLAKILNKNNINSKHCHYIQHLTKNTGIEIKTYTELKKIFINDLEDYKKIYNKKIKVISVIRNPIERLPSSFFQTYHTDEVCFQNKESKDTTIMQKSIKELIDFFIYKIKNKRLPSGVESLDEMSHIFQVDVISNLDSRRLYYYFENNLVDLFVIDFNRLISEDNLNYINTFLNLNLTENASSNLSSEKIYYNKYQEFKNKLPDIRLIIEHQYNNFYFGAF